MIRYLKDPAAIYEESFAAIRREARLERFPPGMAEVAARVVHACGMVEVADRLAFSPGAAEAGRAALRAGAPVLCDCEMAAAGIIRAGLPGPSRVASRIGDPGTAERARRLGTTRSAAAVDAWEGEIGGAVAVIGNAPTALFRLLERLDGGWPAPALILGFPVGFVGADRSKEELAADPRGAEFVTLAGRQGGSAMAAAALNAIAALARDPAEEAPAARAGGARRG